MYSVNATLIENTNPNIRNMLWLKALNSAIVNGTYDKTTRHAHIVNGDYGLGRLNTEINTPVCINAHVALLDVYDCAEDIMLINNGDLPHEVLVKKMHVLEKETCTVATGDIVKKGQTIAYRDSPYYQVGSKLDGEIEVIHTLKEDRVVIKQRFKLANTDGVKLIGYDAQKATSRVDVNRFELVSRTASKEMIDSFHEFGVKVESVPESYTQIDIVGDASSVIKRESSGFLAHITLGLNDPTGNFDESDWDTHRVIYAGKVLDKKTGLEHDAIIGYSSFVVGEQVPNYELKVPKSINKLSGKGNACPSTDIFTQGFMAMKFGEPMTDYILGQEIFDNIDWQYISQEGRKMTGQYDIYSHHIKDGYEASEMDELDVTLNNLLGGQ